MSFRRAGFRFYDFSSIDRAMAAEPGVARSFAPGFWRAKAETKPPQGTGLGVVTADALLLRSLPQVGDGVVGLRQALTEIGMASPIAVLRYVHMKDSVSNLPAGARVLSAGCGKALAEVALAISNPDISWLAVDLDPARYRYGKDVARNADATNIQSRSWTWSSCKAESLVISTRSSCRRSSCTCAIRVEASTHSDST